MDDPVNEIRKLAALLALVNDIIASLSVIENRAFLGPVRRAEPHSTVWNWLCLACQDEYFGRPKTIMNFIVTLPLSFLVQ
jgi:hypothetical protein